MPRKTITAVIFSDRVSMRTLDAASGHRFGNRRRRLVNRSRGALLL
jgi:hypothetical protein